MKSLACLSPGRFLQHFSDFVYLHYLMAALYRSLSMLQNSSRSLIALFNPSRSNLSAFFLPISFLNWYLGYITLLRLLSIVRTFKQSFTSRGLISGYIIAFRVAQISKQMPIVLLKLADVLFFLHSVMSLLVQPVISQKMYLKECTYQYSLFN